MKKILLIAVLFLFAACGVDRSNPEKVAEKYLKVYFDFEYEKAKEWTAPAGIGMLDMAIAGMELEGLTPAQARKEFGVPGIRVHDSMVTGDYAYVSYSLVVSEDDATDQREVLSMMKDDKGDWYVMY